MFMRARWFKKVVCSCFILLALLTASSASGKTIYYVTPGGNGWKDGDSWEDAMDVKKFREALEDKEPGEYWLAKGTYTLTDIGHLTNRKCLRLLNGIELYGGFAGTEENRDDRDWEKNKTILNGDLGSGDHSLQVVIASNVDATAILDGFTITGGSASGYGGGMLMYNNSSPTVRNCIFSANKATSGGGGMYINNTSNPTLDNCRFSKNQAISANPVSGGGSGGGLYISNSSNPELTNCTFSENEAKDTGGGMYIDDSSNPKLTNCTFSGNTATNTSGGGMYINKNSSPTLEDCTFSGNKAKEYGGAMYIYDNCTPTLTSCAFSGNTATNTSGGGMYINKNSSPTLESCTFSGNKANTSGGGMYIDDSSEPTLTSCDFLGNTATNTSGGGMYINKNSSPTLEDCAFSGNKANTSGGAMYIDDSSNPKLTNCYFSENTATNSNGGGMYINNYCTPTLESCTFSGNKAKDYGGGMYVNNNCTLTLTSCDFSGNVAECSSQQKAGGGGMYINNNCTPKLTSCAFSKNEAKENGGGMYIFGNCTPKLTSCTFSENEAKEGSGGAMYISTGSHKLTDCTFSKNEAKGSGGGMNIVNTINLELTGCTFLYNKSANDKGGGISIADSNSTLEKCTFSENEAGGGGGMYIKGNGSTLTNCTFSENEAKSANGGGIYTYFHVNLTLMNCTFLKNTAGQKGHGMLIDYYSSSTVTNTIFWGDNSAEKQVEEKDNSTPTITYSVVDTDIYGDATNTAADPKLDSLKDNGGPTLTCALLAGSSAIDSGTDTGAPSTDQRGVERPKGGGVDIGAYELEVGTLKVTITPDEAVTGGAKWSPNSGATWHDSGESVFLAPGNHTITFKTIGGWTKPVNQIVTVTKERLTECEATYTPGATPEPTPEPKPNPTPGPEPTPGPAPTPTPTPTPPVPLQPVDPPEGPNFLRAIPLTVTLPPAKLMEGQKKSALRKAFREALVPNSLIEDLLELLAMDDSGQIYIGDYGIEQLRRLLDELEIAEGVEMSPLAVIRASLDAQGASAYSPEAGTMILFFELRNRYNGLRCDRLQVVKGFSSERAVLFERVYQIEDLRDRCAAVVKMKGTTLKRVLKPSETITSDCRLALAIKDGGMFDLDGMRNGLLVDPAFVVAGERKNAPDPSGGEGGGGGGCATQGFAPALLILLTPLALLTVRK